MKEEDVQFHSSIEEEKKNGEGRAAGFPKQTNALGEGRKSTKNFWEGERDKFRVNKSKDRLVLCFPRDPRSVGRNDDEDQEDEIPGVRCKNKSALSTRWDDDEKRSGIYSKSETTFVIQKGVYQKPFYSLFPSSMAAEDECIVWLPISYRVTGNVVNSACLPIRGALYEVTFSASLEPMCGARIGSHTHTHNG